MAPFYLAGSVSGFGYGVYWLTVTLSLLTGTHFTQIKLPAVLGLL